MQTASALCVQIGKTPVEGGGLPRLHRQPHPAADDQRGDLRADGGVGTREAIEFGDDARHASPDGALTLADFIGLDVCLAVLNVLHDGFGDPSTGRVPCSAAWSPPGSFGRKSPGLYSY